MTKVGELCNHFSLMIQFIKNWWRKRKVKYIRLEHNIDEDMFDENQNQIFICQNSLHMHEIQPLTRTRTPSPEPAPSPAPAPEPASAPTPQLENTEPMCDPSELSSSSSEEFDTAYENEYDDNRNTIVRRRRF